MLTMTRLRDENGFTMMELLIASVVTVIVLGGAVALTSQIQQGYRRQLEDSAAEQEARYALDWIGRYVRGADNDPFNRDAVPGTTDCPAAGTPIDAIQLDPDGDTVNNDIRIMTDANPPDGLFGGPDAAGNCEQANEDVTISLDNLNNTIVFLDNNTGGAVSTRTDTVIEDLRFFFRDSNHAVTAVANNVVYVETQITIRTRTLDAATGAPVTRTLSSEVKIRSRG